MSREEIYSALGDGKKVWCKSFTRLVSLNEWGDLNISPIEWCDCFTV